MSFLDRRHFTQLELILKLKLLHMSVSKVIM